MLGKSYGSLDVADLNIMLKFEMKTVETFVLTLYTKTYDKIVNCILKKLKAAQLF
jgi:hypothetical protein